MTTMAHVDPEEVMAWLDGELPAEQARAIADHIEDCLECAALANEFRRTSAAISAWEVPTAPTHIEQQVLNAAGPLRPRSTHTARWHWERWAAGFAAASVLVLVLAVVSTSKLSVKKMAAPPGQLVALSAPATSAPASSELSEMLPDEPTPAGGGGPSPVAKGRLPQFTDTQISSPKAQPAIAAPMIARAVSLTLQVKDAVQARASLEQMLARHHGYMAEMSATGEEGSARELHASLRIPAAELRTALAELRALGRVESETQSGEELSAQHEDLEARLKNSRETEARLQAILQQRTGRISDVLDVEQEIARVRGEIEGMEAEQEALEHRVGFAGVDLSAAEEYRAEFRSPDSAGTRMRNAFVTGFENARDSVLGIVLFFEEYGPAIVVWLLFVGGPAIWIWRRYRRALRS